LPPHQAFAHLFAERVLPEPLQDFVLRSDDVDMLLSDGELEALVLALGDVEPSLDRPWEPQLWVHKAYRSCVREVGNFAFPEADAFARLSVDLGERLTRGRLPLHEGITIVRSWVRSIRDLLDDMGRLDVVPRPRGTFPTPTAAGHLSLGELPPSVQDAVHAVRAAVGKNPGLANTKTDEVARAVGGRRESVFAALRWLESVGEYHGRRRRGRGRAR
jgi:hypothetical protein